MTFKDAIECPDHPGQLDHVAVWLPPPKQNRYKCTKITTKNGEVNKRYNTWREARYVVIDAVSFMYLFYIRCK